MTRGYSKWLAQAHPHPLSRGRRSKAKPKRLHKNELRTVNEHLSVLVLLWSAWLPTSLINDMASHLINLTSLFIRDYKGLLYIKCQFTEQETGMTTGHSLFQEVFDWTKGDDLS